MNSGTDVKDFVRRHYGDAATRVARGEGRPCCGIATATAAADPISSGLYDALQTGELPDTALLASLGCGNPTALAELQPGETVLDLGSGGGIDVLLSAKRVGPTGMAFGLDMTREMLALAERNKRESGLRNVVFLRGDIENIPLPDDTVDVVISNCVINLSADKDRVLREAFRVLKPGGRFAVSDIVVRGEVPAPIRADRTLWAGCVAGALRDSDYLARLHAAGFENAAIEVTRVYGAEDARALLSGRVAGFEALARQVDGLFASGFVRATKPIVPALPEAVDAAATAATSSGCGPRCC